MSYDEMSVNVYCPREYQGQIIALAKEHQVEMTDFEGMNPMTSVSPFPLLDPIALEAITQATLIIVLGTKSVKFISALIDLVDKSKGQVKAIDRKTRKAPTVNEEP